LGLYDYNARYYDPALGRFVQADTVVPKLVTPQSLNRYTYVLNNPLNLVDPTGHQEATPTPPLPGLPPPPPPTPSPNSQATPTLPTEQEVYELWLAQILANLLAAGPWGEWIAQYMIEHGIGIVFGDLGSGRGADVGWLGGNIILNSRSFSLQTSAADAWMLSLIAHEVVHMQQGPPLAWSIRGEIEAWQIQNKVYRELTGTSLGEWWTKMEELDVNSDPANLLKAREYIRNVVGPGSSYPPAQDWFPLVPGWGLLVSPLWWFDPAMPHYPYGPDRVCFGNTCSQ